MIFQSSSSPLVRATALEPGEHVVEARELSVGYDGAAVCAPASFRLDPGEALFLVGVTGAGKSTLLRTCCGQQRPLSGHVSVLGLEPSRASAGLRSAVARDTGEEAFFPALSVREHLTMVALGHGLAEADEVVDSVLEGVGIARVADSTPDRLSSGQRRRVVLASVLVRPRCLLVLDEPEQRLDHATRLALAETMVAERRAGGALLVVSHDPLLVRAAATSVLLVGDETQMLTVAEGVHAVEEGR